MNTRKLIAYHCSVMFDTNHGVAYTDGIVCTDADPFNTDFFMKTIRNHVERLVNNNALNEFRVSSEDMTIISITALGEQNA